MDFGCMTTSWKAVDETLGALVDAGLLEVHIPQRSKRTLRYRLIDRNRCVELLEKILRRYLYSDVPDERVDLS